MIKKEKKVVTTVEETKKVNEADVTSMPTEEIITQTSAPAKTAPAKTKTPTKKTKSESTKRAVKSSKETKTANEVKEIKEVPTVKEVKEVTPATPLTPQVFFQFTGTELAVTPLINQIKETWIADGHEETSLKSLNVYIKPEEGAAYYVINEMDHGKVAL